ncbi:MULTISPECIES: potassium-transporting ATPase subunit KdpC [Halobacterium]|uniref:Potassium-transporting ATPase KdpC subunit n=3 Tax=Halobacterium salinarum NRC-34001 TaxID=2886895 RepID=KDPC_HALSA|nr:MULTISPECIES: potassium-transporting ATPase subunit KdpC [Halobacterium]B0R9M1.1 RecName: Full=Potassium-transporting ATPase KdpC subunit; AltName: Full=ATP phosphohydrolase [potassium-transporting] C chain; AltName: Full=Potassium-binding and translocating subunit C; AltName: Full=Potassium-translocating ATPase C chain [Halobacterium salinarum R1]P57687.1 RecName: Full=Potassium-transporting ATPase KdpC subunit; AltName: Full=ATP phosphohydrolase [potassium-transporting] C chain; AltName: Ful
MNRQDLAVPLRLLGVSLLVFGLLYQGSLMAIGDAVFPNSSAGSPVYVDGQEQPVGSQMIGQQFRPGQPEDVQYFWSRPSANDYNAMTSASTNWGPTNPLLSERVRADLQNISQYETPDDSVPVNLVSESGSSYDAHISPAAAEYQVLRVANQTGISEQRLNEMIDEATKEPWLGIWGHERVNVLELNLMVRDALNEQNETDQNSDMNASEIANGDH